MKCSCDAERPFNPDRRHLAMNASGVNTATDNIGALPGNTGKLRVRIALRSAPLRGSIFQLPHSGPVHGAGSTVDDERSSVAPESWHGGADGHAFSESPDHGE